MILYTHSNIKVHLCDYCAAWVGFNLIIVLETKHDNHQETHFCSKNHLLHYLIDRR